MSDFLGHLVARSLDLTAAPAVRPRLASRFEPVTQAVAPPLEETVEEIMPAVAPATGPAFAETPAAPQAHRPAPHPRPLSHPPSPTARERGVTFGPTDSDFSSSLSGTGRAEGRGGEGEGLRVATEVHVTQLTPPQPPVQERRRGEEPKLPAPPAPARLTPARDRSAPPAEPPATERRPQVEPVIRRVEVERVFTPIPPPPAATPAAPPAPAAPAQAIPSVAPVPPILQPRVQIVERDPFPTRREEPATEPVIHVTIGRIEVRATPAPKFPVRDRKVARPAVDLEEYLRQRAKGEGR